MVVRVVCGLSATMAIFAPTRAFSSVDFPALGRPRMETKPDRKPAAGWFSVSSLMRHGLPAPDAHLLDAQFIACQHIDVDPVAFHGLSGLRHAAQPLRYQAAHGGRFNLPWRPELQHVREAREIEIAGDDVAARAV